MTSIPAEFYEERARKPSEILQDTVKNLSKIAMLSKSFQATILADLESADQALLQAKETPTISERFTFWSKTSMRIEAIKDARTHIADAKHRLETCVTGKFINRQDQDFYLREPARFLESAIKNAKEAGV